MSVMNATKHGDPPITVAGATKKRSKARKVYMPSGATIMHRYVHHHNARLPPRWSSQPHARVPSTVQACAGTTLWRCSLRRGWRQISDGACSQATLCNCVLTVCSVPRALRPSCIAFMTSHRTFLRLDFGEVLRASRQRVVRVATACVACTSAHPVCNVRARCNPGCHRKRTRATTGIYLRTRRTPRWTSGWLPTT